MPFIAKKNEEIFAKEDAGRAFRLQSVRRLIQNF